jgi:hypothetical protein
MVFTEQDLGPEPPTRPNPVDDNGTGSGGSKRPQLKVVK